MRSGLASLGIMLVASGLAGCGPKPTVDAKAATQQPDSTAASPAPTPVAVTLTPRGAPQRRDGYWEMASYAEGGSPMAKQFYCVGAGSEQKYSVFDALVSVGDCDKKDFKRTATGWSFETRCKLMDATTTQSGTISGDFQQAFRIEQTVTQGGATQKGTIRGTRVSECPSKFKPGDLVDASGERVGNLLG